MMYSVIMPDGPSKDSSPRIELFYARLDSETRSLLKCSAIDALKRVRNDEFRGLVVYDQISIFSLEIDRMDQLLRGRIKKKA